MCSISSFAMLAPPKKREGDHITFAFHVKSVIIALYEVNHLNPSFHHLQIGLVTSIIYLVGWFIPCSSQCVVVRLQPWWEPWYPPPKKKNVPPPPPTCSSTGNRAPGEREKVDEVKVGPRQSRLFCQQCLQQPLLSRCVTCSKWLLHDNCEAIWGSALLT